MYFSTKGTSPNLVGNSIPLNQRACIWYTLQPIFLSKKKQIFWTPWTYIANSRGFFWFRIFYAIILRMISDACKGVFHGNYYSVISQVFSSRSELIPHLSILSRKIEVQIYARFPKMSDLLGIKEGMSRVRRGFGPIFEFWFVKNYVKFFVEKRLPYS